MNLPNRLTTARVFLTIGFVGSMSVDWRYAHTLALLLFVIASITDYADGAIARHRGQVTDFGKLMDPLADKIMIAGAFICLVPSCIPAWAAVVIISREFLITGLRLVAASKQIVLPAEALGKHKTGWQIGAVIFFLLFLAVRELNLHPEYQEPLDGIQTLVGPPLIGVVLVLTLCSGFSYLWKNREILKA